MNIRGLLWGPTYLQVDQLEVDFFDAFNRLGVGPRQVLDPVVYHGTKVGHRIYRHRAERGGVYELRLGRQRDLEVVLRHLQLLAALARRLLGCGELVWRV